MIPIFLTTPVPEVPTPVIIAQVEAEGYKRPDEITSPTDTTLPELVDGESVRDVIQNSINSERPTINSAPIINTSVRANIFRPDDRNRVIGNAQYLDDTYSVGVSYFSYANPDIDVIQPLVSYSFDDETEVAIGASIVEGDIVPEFRAETLFLNDHKIYLSRGLNTSDPRAVDALIQQNVVGLNLKFQDVSTNFRVTFNSDDVEVYENWIAIPLDDYGVFTFKNYLRGASEESDDYWSPDFFNATGVQIAYPLSNECGIGVQPGFTYSDNELRPVLPVGAQCRFNDLTIRAGYSYGLDLQAEYRTTF